MSKNKSEKTNKWEKVAEDSQEEALLDPASEIENDNEHSPSLTFESRDQLETELNAMETKYNEALNALRYTQAEFDNFRKRSERDVADALKYGPQKLLNELLPVVDSIEKSLEIMEQHPGDVGAVKEGMQLTHQVLLNTLEKYAVKQINPINEVFNPTWHQAMAMQEQKDVKSGVVMSVLQKGYTLNDRLLRPALVVVAK